MKAKYAYVFLSLILLSTILPIMAAGVRELPVKKGDVLTWKVTKLKGEEYKFFGKEIKAGDVLKIEIVDIKEVEYPIIGKTQVAIFTAYVNDEVVAKEVNNTQPEYSLSPYIFYKNGTELKNSLEFMKEYYERLGYDVNLDTSGVDNGNAKFTATKEGEKYVMEYSGFILNYLYGYDKDDGKEVEIVRETGPSMLLIGIIVLVVVIVIAVVVFLMKKKQA